MEQQAFCIMSVAFLLISSNRFGLSSLFINDLTFNLR
nr:MAG TPA: hypothetical protein [Caudoviricetes sp.]